MRPSFSSQVVVGVVVVFGVIACGSSATPSGFDTDGEDAGGEDDGGSKSKNNGGADGGGTLAHGDSGSLGTIPDTGVDPCGHVIKAVFRDFKPSADQGGHPDFERDDFVSEDDNGTPGLVKDDLGSDDKPVYALPGPSRCTHGPTEFAQWYNDVPGVNM